MTKEQLRQTLIFFACIAAVFYVPYVFPPKPGISASAMAGFSNLAAQVVLLLGALAFAIWTKGWGQTIAQRDEPTSRKVLIVPCAVALCAAALCTMVWHYSSILGPHFEATYFTDRFNEQLAGGVAYRDFTFDYGPLLYYPSWWIAKILSIPVVKAYYIFFGLEWVLGITLTWHVISRLRSRSIDRVLAFLMVSLVWFLSIFDSGIQYTPLRFILGSAFAVWLHRSWERSTMDHSPRRIVLSVALGCIGFTVLLLLSPEQGLSFWMATLLFFGLCARDRRMLVPMVGGSVACLAIALIAFKMGLLQSLFSFGGGDFNLPLLVGPQSLVLVAMLVCVACVTVSSFYSGQTQRVELFLVALALTSIPAALGRADPGHIFINTMPALIVLSLAQLQHSSRGPILMAGWLLYSYAAYLGHTRLPLHALTHDKPEAVFMPKAEDLPPPSSVLWAPMGYWTTINGQVGPRVHTGKYFGFGLIFTGLADQKIAELKAHPQAMVVLANDWRQKNCEMLDPETTQHILFSLFDSLYTPPLRPAPNVRRPLCNFIDQHYTKSRYQLPGGKFDVYEPVQKSSEVVR